MLVEKNSAVLQHISAVEKPWFVKYGLDRNHFDMHNFGPRDALFDNTIKLALDKIASSFRAFNLDESLHSLAPDETGCVHNSSISHKSANFIHSLLTVFVFPGDG